MRSYTDLSKAWSVRAQAADTEIKYEEIKTDLPFIHSAAEIKEATFSNEWTVPSDMEGETVYIEFRQVSGDVSVYSGGALVCRHNTLSTRFRVRLTQNAVPGEKFQIKAVVVPAARADGNFIFGTVSLITVSHSHFDLDDDGTNGIYLDINTDKPTAQVRVKAKVEYPNNYDVLSFTIINSNGESICTKTQKPTEGESILEIPSPEYWGGQKDASMYTLKASLVRDATILDMLEIPFGIKELVIEKDRFLRLNGIKLPLNGIALSNCSHIKTDRILFDLLDANSLIADSIPSKTDLLEVCDKSGTVFWYDLPYTGTDRDMDELREFLKQNYNHPSLAFACCSGFADSEYFKRFRKICRDCGTNVFTAMKFDIRSAAFLPDELPDVIAITVKGGNGDENFFDVKSRFDELNKAHPETSFALFAYPPAPDETADGKKADENALCTWHERLWNTFCREKSIIGYFAGYLSDAPEHKDSPGLVSTDREHIKDVFWFYKSQFSANEFVKICAGDLIVSDKKYIDIKCYTNTSPLRILVNGETKRRYRHDEIYNGVFVFRRIPLKNRTNIIEVSSGDQFDRAEINYEK